MKLTEREQIASSKLQEIAKDIKEKLPDGCQQHYAVETENPQFLQEHTQEGHSSRH